MNMVYIVYFLTHFTESGGCLNISTAYLPVSLSLGVFWFSKFGSLGGLGFGVWGLGMLAASSNKSHGICMLRNNISGRVFGLVDLAGFDWIGLSWPRVGGGL